MSKRKKRIDPRQTNLFDLIEKITATAQPDPPSEGSLDIKNPFMGIIKSAIKQSSSSRWEIAGAMSAFVGTEITKFMLDSWTADSKDGHRFPAIYIPAFCRATEETTPVRMLAEKSGICAVPGKEVILAEVAKRIQRRDNETKEIKKLKVLLEQIS